MWFRVDDGFYSHPKVFAASPAALGLWVVAGSWSSASGTGGHIPTHALGRLLPGAEALADELVIAGLWETTDAGYRFHDWEGYNPSAAEARAAKDRQASGGKLGNHRRWHQARGVVDPSCPWCTDRSPDRLSDRTPDRVPDRSTDRTSDRGAESHPIPTDPADASDASPAAIGSDRPPGPNRPVPDTPTPVDQHTHPPSGHRLPDGGTDSGANPPSRPDPSRPAQVSPWSVGGVGESADAGASGMTDSDMLPAPYIDPITNPAPAKRKKADPKGHRLPDDFTVTDDMRAWAAEKAPGAGWDDHEAFCDYWRGIPGARGRKTDWVATWRNWMRKASAEPGRSRGTRTGDPAPRSTTSERVEGWLNLSNTTDTADTAAPGSQMALEAPAHQEVTPWPAA